jgi:RNA polymerase sigma-70 factor (ECF subfamily)
VNYNGLSDEALIELVSRGEADALSVLYDRYSPLAFALARRMLGDGEAASEVIQDAFLNVWRGAAIFQPERGRFSSWLMTMVRHLAIDELRRRRSRMGGGVPRAFAISFMGNDQPSDEGEDGVWARLHNHEIRKALSQLPKPQREAIELAYFHGLTQREIADHLGDSLGTVKTRVRLGLQKLRELLYPYQKP